MHIVKILSSAVAVATLLACGPASAQSTALQPFPLSGAATSDTANVKIAVTYQFFIEGTTRTMEDQTTLADQGRKHLYLMLAKECVVLRETIADSCAIERASVNAQLRKQVRSTSSGVRISASASYKIELKKLQQAKKN